MRSSEKVTRSIKSSDSLKPAGNGAGAGLAGSDARRTALRRGGAGAGEGRIVRSSADATSVRSPRSLANVPNLEAAASSAGRAGGHRESGWSGGGSRHRHSHHHHYSPYRSYRSHFSVGFGVGFPFGYYSRTYHTSHYRGFSSWRSSFWFGSYDPWYYEPWHYDPWGTFYPSYYSSVYFPIVRHRRSYIGIGVGLGTPHYCPHHYLNLHYCGCDRVHVQERAPVVVEVPPPVIEPAPVVPAGDGGGAEAPPAPAEPAPEPAKEGGETGSVEGLRPAQLNFWLGLESLRQGKYNDGAESLYNALLEDPGNGVIKVILAESLFAIGEYRYAARYLREALVDWEEFTLYQWSPAALYSNAEDFPARLQLLEKEAAENPENLDLQLVLGYERFVHGDADGARGIFGTLSTSAPDEPTRKLSTRFLGRIESLSTGENVAPPPGNPTGRFLKSLSLEDLRALNMR